MTTSDRIRSLARDGLAVAEIARQLGVRYQHAYNVLKAAGLLAAVRSNVLPRCGGGRSSGPKPRPQRPALTSPLLLEGGFSLTSQWRMNGDALVLDRPAPKERGVYSFVQGGAALYVGLATMGLARRLYFYGRPGATQTTSLRINALLKAELAASRIIEVYTAHPADLEWNGLPVDGSAGLEVGLIQAFHLPWNIRGVPA